MTDSPFYYQVIVVEEYFPKEAEMGNNGLRQPGAIDLQNI